MKKLVYLFFLATFLLTNWSANAQQAELERFLAALQSPEESASKATIRNLSFSFQPEKPLLDFGTVTGDTFDSDTAGVKVYRASVVCRTDKGEVVMGKKLQSDKKMVAVMLFDKIRNTWAVFSFREWLNPEQEYGISKAKVDRGEFYSAKEYVYRNLAYWALMAGKAKASSQYTNLAIQYARENKNEDFLTETEKALRAILR